MVVTTWLMDFGSRLGLFTSLKGTALAAISRSQPYFFLLLFPLETSSVYSSVKKSGHRSTQLFISKRAAFLLPFSLLQSNKHKRFWPGCSCKAELAVTSPTGKCCPECKTADDKRCYWETEKSPLGLPSQPEVCHQTQHYLFR